MAILEYQIEIAAPPQKVFAYISDLEKHTDWSGGLGIRRTSDGPVSAGSTYETQEAGPFGKTLTEKVEVISYELDERFGWRSYGPLGSWFDWSFEVRRNDVGTVLAERLDRSKGLAAAVMLKLVFLRQFRKSMPEGLAKIKSNLESGQGPGG